MEIDRKVIIIDGSQFSNLDGFYDEVEKKLVQKSWGRNLNAFDDILYGGFGGREYNEAFVLIWKHAEKSRLDLGYPETVKLLEKTFYYLQPGTRKETLNQLLKAKDGTGETIFDTRYISSEGIHILNSGWKSCSSLLSNYFCLKIFL